ncbi:structural maintenance of chromosome protein 3 [Scheffersomyces coipomensis]|uniref:structural maintenance of chromosome protein 3 n=1 Tax=Scheffersomyces coipomensis TaxID=1788519 RepID=UPI00315C8699
MNLMDLLSGDPPSSIYSTKEIEADTIMDLADSNGSQVNHHEVTNLNLAADLSEGVEHPNNGIYYVPTTLTRLQKELMELVLQTFSSDILQELRAKKSRTSIDSLLDSSSNAEHESDTFDKISLIMDQLSIVESHPSLLVDHFMPKKLLLSETNERLLSMSGKLQLFDKMLNLMVEKCNHETGFHVLVVAQSVKELELVEGVIIGKELNYRNLSSAKLYDDGKSIPNFNEKSSKGESKVCLYLATSQQLYNKYMSSLGTVNSKFNLIFSLDAKLDASSPSIELIRSETVETPILIPIPVFSLQHIGLQIPQPTTNFSFTKDTNSAIYKWNLRMIKTFIVNRFNLFETKEPDFFLEQYGGGMKQMNEWFKSWSKLNIPHNLLKSFDEQLAINFTDDKLIKKINNNYSNLDIPKTTKVELTNFSYKSYKSALAESLNSRVTQIEDFVSNIYETSVPEFRAKETLRQVQLDEDETTIANSYRKLRRLNEDAGFAEKKFTRIDSDLTKVHESKEEFERKLHYLQDHLSKDVSEEEISKQQESIDKLNEELITLSKEFDKLKDEGEEIRSKYQTSSASAAQIANKVNKFKAQNNKVITKIDGPGMKSLPSLIKKDTLINYEYQLNKLKKENDFLVQFIQEKIDKVSRERQSVLEASTSGSSSRPSNRISRASTPLN